MRVGSLFAGIGGIDLGLERAGFEVVWQVEKDQFCRDVLAKHWPTIPRHVLVEEVGAHNLEDCDVICGGFPCQDISTANPDGLGLDGARSGLWFEFARIIRELRPRYVFVENVPVLTTRGLDQVLGALAEMGYDAEWFCVPASAFGAPHLRWRLFIVAMADAGSEGCSRGQERDFCSSTREQTQRRQDVDGCCDPIGGCDSRRNGDGEPRGWWSVEPPVGRVADGVPGRVDSLRALGNAVVPQIAEWIGHRIMAHALATSQIRK